MCWKRFRLKDGHGHCRETNPNASNDSSYKHLPVLDGARLDRGTDDYDDIGIDDRLLPTDGLLIRQYGQQRSNEEAYFAKEETGDRANRAPDVVDSGDSPYHRARRMAEGVLEACTSKNTTEEALIISEQSEVKTGSYQDHGDEGFAPELEETHLVVNVCVTGEKYS